MASLPWRCLPRLNENITGPPLGDDAARAESRPPGNTYKSQICLRSPTHLESILTQANIIDDDINSLALILPDSEAIDPCPFGPALLSKPCLLALKGNF